MILGHFGRHVSPRDLSAVPVSARDGVTAAWLIECAQRQGLRAEGFYVSVDQLAVLSTPAILHTTSSHFVVFEGMTRGRIVIVDPSVGERWYLRDEEARDLLSGTAIAFEPTLEFQPRSRRRLLLRALRPALALDRRASMLVTSVAITLTALTVALGSSWFWSTVLGRFGSLLPTFTALDWTAILVVALALCIMPLLGLVDASIGAQVSARLTRIGRGQPATAGEPDPTTNAHCFASIDPLKSAAFPGVSRIVLVASVLLGAIFTTWSSGGSVAVLLAASSAAIVTSVTVAHLINLSVPAPRHRILFTHLVWCAAVVVSAAIWFGALHLDGAMRAFNSGAPLPSRIRVIVPQVLLAVTTFHIGRVITLGRHWLATYEKLWEALPDQESRSGFTVPDPEGQAEPSRAPRPYAPLLRARGVTLNLGDKRDRILSEVEVELEEGQHVALVGPSGAGKTTLIRAVLGRVNVPAGTITYSGFSFGEYRPSERERLVCGMVQGDRLPDSTISRVLRTYNRNMSLAQMRDVCAHLGFDEGFSSLPLGYDTPVALDGDTLSRGQRQMLMLAHVVASGARLLALDDPLNALDDEVARRVLAGLATLPAAVVVTMASVSALSNLDFRVIHLDGLSQRSGSRSSSEQAPAAANS
jgi:ABC-type bacteriocin/lantibiotic exporter with double-glycine peptidase domain